MTFSHGYLEVSPNSNNKYSTSFDTEDPSSDIASNLLGSFTALTGLTESLDTLIDP